MLPGYELSPRLRLICRVSKWATLALGVLLLALLFTGGVISAITAQAWTQLAPETQAAIQFSDAKKAQVQALAYAGYLAPFLILFGAFRMFSALQTGAVFSLKTVKALRFLGLMVLLEAIFRSLFGSLMILLMTFDASSGHRTLSISIGSQQLIAILVGIIFLIIGHVFTQAVHISDESRQIV